MKIAGLQKLTLIDYPGKIACTIFLFGCNFRCGFCHNPELVIADEISEEYSQEQIIDFLKQRKKYLDAVCITGGEPLINQDIIEFLKKIKQIGYLIKIDTNGTNPELLKKIIDEKLVDYIAMDIKSDKEHYHILANVDIDIGKIEESIKLISDFSNYEFRTTVIPTHHNKEIMKNIGEWMNNICEKIPENYYLQNFISRENKMIDESFEKIRSFSDQELEELKNSVNGYFKNIEIRN